MQKVNIPTEKNQRADEMWGIIEPSAEFEGKTVTDYGCGHGDMMWRAWQAGANVCGVEREPDLCGILTVASSNIGNFTVIHGNLDHLGIYTHKGDIAFCFSVLPYLSDPDDTLRCIYEYSDIAFLEVQYAGDGPGFAHIHNDGDMQKWLQRIGWQNVEAIGSTHTKIRPAWRTIWKCT